MKLSKAVEVFWLDKKLQFSPRTVKTYSYSFRYLVEFTNDTEIESITRADVQRFLDHLATERKMSKRSIHDVVARLSSLWTWAVDELKVTHILKGIEVKYTQNTVDPLTEDEVKRLLSATEYTKNWNTKTNRTVKARRPSALLDRAILLTLLDTGMRAAELLALTVADYNAERGRLHIKHGKGDKARHVILGNRSQKAIYKYLDSRTRTKPADPLFATRDGNFLDRDNLRHKLQKIAAVAGVDNVHPHRFRHTFAINFLRNGGSVLTLQQLLGHSSLEMVRHYSKIAEIDIEAAAQHSVADNWRL